MDNDEEGYIPEYAETIKRLQAAARNEVLPLPGIGDEDLDNSLVEAMIDRSESNEVAEKKRKVTSVLPHFSISLLLLSHFLVLYAFCVMPFSLLFQSWRC